MSASEILQMAVPTVTAARNLVGGTGFDMSMLSFDDYESVRHVMIAH